MFEFEISFDDEDYVQFNQYHLLNSSTGKKTLMYYRFIIPFICLLFVVIFYIAGSDFQLILMEAIAMLIISGLWIGFSKKTMLKSMKKRILKMRKEGKLPYSKEVILKFDDACIYEKAANTENKMNYSLIERVVVTEKAIYLYYGAIQATILPLTAFSNETEKHQFLDFINGKTECFSEKA